MAKSLIVSCLSATSTLCCFLLSLHLMRSIIKYLFVAFAIATAWPAEGQDKFLPYTVNERGDTVYHDQIRPSYVYTGKKKGRKWRKYYKLVHNFGKAYPFALLARDIMRETDSTFDARNMGRWKKDRYVNKLEKELFIAYEKPLRNLTISQGQLMLRLVDRETGMSSYDLIKLYKNRTAAGFWQGVGKLFGADLKARYDPEGIDKQTEELVQIWEKGDYEAFYFSIFGKLPDIPDLRSKRK